MPFEPYADPGQTDGRWSDGGDSTSVAEMCVMALSGIVTEYVGQYIWDTWSYHWPLSEVNVSQA